MADDNARHDAIGLLGLASWPFNVVPIQDASLIWADRKDVRRQIERLVRRLSRHQSSTLHLLWADFGAGKTHTLLYLQQLALSVAGSGIFPVYTVLPRVPRSFVDIYRAIIQGVGFDRMLSVYEANRRSGQESSLTLGALSGFTPGLRTAFEALRIGNDVLRETSIRWLMADPSLTRRELHDASLPSRIRSTDEALAMLSSITKLLLTQSSRVLLMIDEFQRSGLLRRAHLDEMNAGLHTYFNDCPQGLSLILSFSFGSVDNIRHHLNEELQSRADPVILAIPALDKPSACEFLMDLVTESKAPDKDININEDVYPVIAEYVAERGGISPRRLIQAAASVFSESLLDLEDKLITTVDADYARDIMNSLGPIGPADRE